MSVIIVSIGRDWTGELAVEIRGENLSGAVPGTREADAELLKAMILRPAQFPHVARCAGALLETYVGRELELMMNSGPKSGPKI